MFSQDFDLPHGHSMANAIAMALAIALAMAIAMAMAMAIALAMTQESHCRGHGHGHGQVSMIPAVTALGRLCVETAFPWLHKWTYFMGVRSDIRWYPPPHHRIRTNNQGEFDGSGLIPRGTPIGKRTHGVTWLSARCSYPGRNPCPWRDPYRGGGASRRLHKGGRPPSAAAPLCGFLYMGLSMGTGFSLGTSTEH